MGVWITQGVAVLGGLLTLLATFELVFATRSVPAITAQIDSCNMTQSRAARRDMMHALAEAKGGFVFLDLDLVQYPMSCRDPASGGSRLGFDLTLIALDAGEPAGRPADLRGENMIWAVLAPSETRDSTSVSITHQWAEDPGYIALRGLIAVSGRRAEGDYEFTLSPAPFDSTTRALATCTEAIAGRAGLERLRAYISGCML